MTFEQKWHNTFEGVVPLDNSLKYTLSHRWLRIYSLPEGKRYPESNAEWEEWQRRHGQVLQDLLDKDAPVTYLFASWRSSEDDVDHLVSILGGTFLLSQVVEDQASGTDWHIYTSDRLYEYGEIEGILRSVANDELAFNFCIIDFVQQRIISPYDGGIDLILSDELERDSFAERYSTWMSSRTDGL